MERYLLLLIFAAVCHAQTRLGSYNIDPNAVSVSGLSSGGCMATQFHVAHSKKIMGAGIIAGAPYYCAQGNILTATNDCMNFPSRIDVDSLHRYVSNQDKLGSLDDVSNMAADRIYLFSGTLDNTLKPDVVRKTEEFYRHYVTATGAITTVYHIAAQHGFPTENYGGSCGSLNSEYINNCNYNAAFELLNHIYGGGFKRPSSSQTATGQLILFDQKEFFKLAPPATYGMDTAGYVYVPQSCQNSARCRLHIAFHGCKQGRETLGDKYAKNTGYNTVADLNHIIILYPQAKNTLANPNGCWDWWGYSSYAYANQNGFQITGVERMMERVKGNY